MAGGECVLFQGRTLPLPLCIWHGANPHCSAFTVLVRNGRNEAGWDCDSPPSSLPKALLRKTDLICSSDSTPLRLHSMHKVFRSGAAQSLQFSTRTCYRAHPLSYPHVHNQRVFSAFSIAHSQGTGTTDTSDHPDEEVPVDGWKRTVDGLPDYTAEPRGRAKGVEWKLRAKVRLHSLGSTTLKAQHAHTSSLTTRFLVTCQNRAETLSISAGSQCPEAKVAMGASPSTAKSL